MIDADPAREWADAVLPLMALEAELLLVIPAEDPGRRRNLDVVESLEVLPMGILVRSLRRLVELVESEVETQWPLRILLGTKAELELAVAWMPSPRRLAV